MVSVEELKLNFVTRDVAPYGTCIAIPNSDFNPAWEKELQSQGFKVFTTFLNGAPFVLVQLKQMKIPGSPNLDQTRHWSKEEDDKLIKLWNEGQGIPDILPIFPNRSHHAIKMRLARLKEKGVIHSRWTKKKKAPKTKTSEIGPGPEPKPTTLPTSNAFDTSAKKQTPIEFSQINATLNIEFNVNCNDRNAVANFLEIIEKLGLITRSTSA